MCRWVEMDVLLRLCSVIYRLYGCGFEVVSEWLWQPELSRAPRNSSVKTRYPVSYTFSQCNHDSERENESAEFKNIYSSRSSPSPSVTTAGCSWTPPQWNPGACYLCCPGSSIKAVVLAHPGLWAGRENAEESQIMTVLRTLVTLYLIQSNCTRGLQYPIQSDRRLTGSRLSIFFWCISARCESKGRGSPLESNREIWPDDF